MSAELGGDGQRRRVRDEVGFGGPPFFESCWLASGWEPMPTPASGCSAKTRAVSSTRRERSLVRSAPRCRAPRRRRSAAAREEERGRDRRDDPHASVARDGARRRPRRRRAPRGSTASRSSRDRSRGTDDQRRRQRPDAAVPRGDEHDRDPEHDVAAVEAGVAEERGDPEEGRVGVRHSRLGRRRAAGASPPARSDAANSVPARPR